jgi:hypothetical protein
VEQGRSIGLAPYLECGLARSGAVWIVQDGNGLQVPGSRITHKITFISEDVRRDPADEPRDLDIVISQVAADRDKIPAAPLAQFQRRITIGLCVIPGVGALQHLAPARRLKQRMRGQLLRFLISLAGHKQQRFDDVFWRIAPKRKRAIQFGVRFHVPNTV